MFPRRCEEFPLAKPNVTTPPAACGLRPAQDICSDVPRRPVNQTVRNIGLALALASALATR